jgi:hypothetical protein
VDLAERRPAPVDRRRGHGLGDGARSKPSLAASRLARRLRWLAGMTLRRLLPLVAVAACGGDPDDARDLVIGDWTLERELTFDDPCPSFDIATTVEIAVARLDDGALEVRIGDATQRIDGDTLVFTSDESWTSSDGPASPTIEWDLVEQDGELAGTAATRFVFDTEDAGTTCRYAWSVLGTRR